MRKNGINRTLTAIEGGVCAPKGFCVSATRVGFCEEDGQKEDLAMIVTKRRFPSAFVGTNCANVGAHVRLSEKHIRSGLASAVLINGGVANECNEKADVLAENVSRVFARKCNVDRNDMLLISTGRWGDTLTVSAFEGGIPALINGFGDTENHSLAAARALSLDGEGGQCAFSFWLGDIECKIGCIYSPSIGEEGLTQSAHCIFTTDVKIEPKALQKALKSAVNEHFYMLGDHVPSPNDCVCILTSAEAENWEITEGNSDFPKFTYALQAAFAQVCKRMASKTDGRRLLCKVTGARSKNVARAIAKTFTASPRIKRALCAERFDVQELLVLLFCGEEKIDLERLTITIRVGEREVLAYEEKGRIPLSQATLKNLFCGEEIEVILAMQKGNYAATAYGRI